MFASWALQGKHCFLLYAQAQNNRLGPIHGQKLYSTTNMQHRHLSPNLVCSQLRAKPQGLWHRVRTAKGTSHRLCSAPALGKNKQRAPSSGWQPWASLDTAIPASKSSVHAAHQHYWPSSTQWAVLPPNPKRHNCTEHCNPSSINPNRTFWYPTSLAFKQLGHDVSQHCCTETSIAPAKDRNHGINHRPV